MHRRVTPFAFAAAVVLQGCRSDPTAFAPLTAVASVVPAGGSTGVDPTAPIVVSFTGMMRPGMELYAALHEGDVTGPVVRGSWTWSADRTTLTFTPAAPLKSQTRNTLHLGGGMRDAAGHPIDYSRCVSQYGGKWATSEMMGGGMMGNGSMMGPGWLAANGTYGMVFTFTTA
jgi:Big-like domain-containing protein